MWMFWEKITCPLLDAADARTIVECGVDQGGTTQLLLARAALTEGSRVHAVDPAPRIEVESWEAQHGDRLLFHRSLSHAALPEIGPVDAALLDGDHNWFTVRGELELLASSAIEAEAPPPLIFAHDVRWPYGRRDMYYDPESVPVEHRHEVARSGVLMGRSDLDPEGINASFWNATQEGGGRNGVLTAIEDFLADQAIQWELAIVEGFYGLAVLAPSSRLDAAPELRSAFDRLSTSEFLQQWANILEGARLDAEMRAWKAIDAASQAEEAGVSA